MKLLQILRWLILFAFFLSCQSDQFEFENSLNENNTFFKINDKDIYKKYTLSKEISDLYFSDEWKNMSEEEFKIVVDTITNWINNKKETLENNCKKAENCEDKLRLMDLLLFMERQIDELGLDGVTMTTDLCDGFMDDTNTRIRIITEDYNLEVGEEIDLEYEVLVGNSKCKGNVNWASLDPNVAMVDQEGHVTAKNPGRAHIFAFLEGYKEISGSIVIDVAEPEDSQYEVVFIVDTSPEGIWGVFDPGGIKDSAASIYSALSSNFSDGFKFGLAGFDHHTVMPFGNTIEVCIEEEWDLTYADWQPLIEQAPFVKFLDFTNDRDSITKAIEDIRLMCSVCNAPHCMSGSPYTAIIETINNYEWSQYANKAIIIYGTKPATYYTGYTNDNNSNGVEGVSGLNATNVIELASANGIKIFTISGKYSNTYFGEWLNQEYQMIANGTNGHFISGAHSASLASNAVINMVSTIKGSF